MLAQPTFDYDSKTDLDFRDRLIAKFEIPRAQSFSGIGFEQIPETTLYPRGDKILDLCNQLKAELRDEFGPGDLGESIKEWTKLEDCLLQNARRRTQRNISLREAISVLAKERMLWSETAQQLESLRSFRNAVCAST